MKIDTSRIREGDKVLLRNGSKILVEKSACKTRLLVFTHYLSLWNREGEWAPKTYPINPFDIVGVIRGSTTQSKDGQP